MHADAAALVVAEVSEHVIVEIDELLEQSAGRVELQGEPTFGEVDLHRISAGVEAATDVGDGFSDEIGTELLWGVAGET